MWFGVSIFMKADCPTRAKDEALWEESIVVIEATSEQEAKRLTQRRKGAEVDAEHFLVCVPVPAS